MHRTQLVQPWMPRGGAALGIRVEAGGLLGVTGADLLHVGVEQLRLRVAGAPDVHPLGPDVDVDPRVVPADEALDRVGELAPGERGELLGRLAGVALSVSLEVPVVDVGRALDEDRRRVAQTAARR